MSKYYVYVVMMLIVIFSFITGNGVTYADSLNVRLVGSWPCDARDIFVLGSYAYVADGSAGLRIIDVSNPSDPQEVGYHGTDIQDVYVRDSYAYVIDWGGLAIIDVSNPLSPQVVGYCGELLSPTSVYVSSGLSWACVTGCYFERQLCVINISSPSNPYMVGHCDLPDRAFDVHVVGFYAYVADDDFGLRVIYNLPYNPGEVGIWNTPGYTHGVYVSGSYAYVADWYAGLRVIDVSNPSNPQEVGYYNTPGTAWHVHVSDPYAYVADGSAGLQIYEFYQQSIEESDHIVSNSRLQLLQNPISGDYIELWLPTSHSDTPILSIYNSFGQIIRKLYLNRLFSGEHMVRIPTKELSSGVYFLKFKTGAYKETRKLLLIR